MKIGNEILGPNLVPYKGNSVPQFMYQTSYLSVTKAKFNNGKWFCKRQQLPLLHPVNNELSVELELGQKDKNK